MGRIGHFSQIWLQAENSMYRRVFQDLMNLRPEMRRVFADSAVLEQVKEFEQNQLHHVGALADNTAENMERLALLDTLTGTYNGRSFLHHLDQTLKHAWRYNRMASLCMVSIDAFEEIAHQYGSLTANAVLRICADAIKKNVRSTDIVARYSGTDFGIVLPDTDTAAATITAEKIRETLSTQVITHNWNHIKITSSLGLVTYPTHAFDRDELISIAMQALFVSKSRGGDRVCTI